MATLKSEGGSLWSDIRKVYKFGQVIGGGTFGSVRVAYRREDSKKKLVAVKSISKKHMSQNEIEALIKEVEIISSLDHVNIIDFKETYQDSQYFHIVMELCTGKELFDKLIENGNLTEKTVCRIIYKILKAILYCHTVGVIHRDIKAENIIFENDQEDSEIKIIDFGLSSKYNPKQKMKSILGTPYYVAPEVLQGEYDDKCDVWSIGVLTYVLLTGSPPFKGKTDFEIFNSIVSNEVSFPEEKFKKVSIEAVSFISECLEKNPKLRPNAVTALKHKWFDGLKKETFDTARLSRKVLENMRLLTTPSKFKKLVLAFMVNLCTAEESKKLKEMFEAIDTNNEGFIDVEELTAAFKSVKIDLSEEKVQEILDNVDILENGKINYTEFLMATIDLKTKEGRHRIEEAFNYLDVDGSGCITVDDLQSAFLRAGKQILNPEELEKMMSEVNEKKEVTIEEFLKMFEI